MNITVTLDASPALLQAIQSLAGALGRPAAAIAENHLPVNETAAKKNGKVKAVAEEPVPAVVTEAAQISPVEEPAAAAPAVATKEERLTIEKLRAAATASKETREKARKLLAEFGVPNLTSLPEDTYPQFLAKLQAA